MISYKGIGRFPKNLSQSTDPAKRMLLNSLPKLLQGYGNTYSAYPNDYSATVVIVVDLDSKCLELFREELFEVLNSCSNKPETLFCIAIEEGEAWLLGDMPAIKRTYPNAKKEVLKKYVNDSICGTWEQLADAVYHGGAAKLTSQGWHAVGKEKSLWAENIVPHMDMENNNSPSFCYFRDNIKRLANIS